MSVVDITIVAIVIISLLIGLFRGFIREVLSLISWIAALWLAYVYSPMGASYLEPYLDQPPLRIVVAFAGIFLVALIVFSIVSYLLYRLLAIAGISGLDRSLGLLFGVVRGFVIVSLLILAATFMDFTTQPWWKDSLLVAHFEPLNELIRSLLPEDVARFVQPQVA